AANIQPDGSLSPNGGFEADTNADAWPDKWGRLKTGGSWENEEDNHFLRMTSTVPGEMVMLYQTYDLPAGIQALELTWRQRVTSLKTGKMPWFDARILMEFKDAAGKNLQEKPGASYTQKDTKGWVDKSTRFLVPEGAVTLVLMPALFQVQSGTFDLDNLALKPTDPAPIFAAKKEREKAEAARYVPPEEPNKAKWPKMLTVVGNRLHDTEGKEVWLQGVNAGGLETLPQDLQAIKSVVVAIDDWKSNCVRLPMKEEFWYGKSPYQKDDGEEYRKKIDQIITLAANRGAYLVLDLHRFRAPKQEHADFWKDAAARYKDHPAVLFDVFNEPHGISWEVWKNGGFVGNKKGTDESAFLTAEEKAKNQGFQSVGMQGLVDAVRSTGAKNIIIAGGLFWCNDLTGIVNGYALDDKGGNGIMYSWHTYNWHPGWARVIPVAEKYPIFLGEVGADVNKMHFIPESDQEDPYTFIPDMLGFIQKYKINWTGWCLHPKATPVMISDWNYTPTPFWGVFAKDALAGKQFEMKKMR
ncbi:MAG: cellulase family glycosylhydrolase, partial [Verrucomicrobiota bacterium]